MPESKSRKKATYTPPPASAAPKPNPRWWVPLMLGLMILGLVWIVVFYISNASGGQLPLPIGSWNLVIGGVLIIAGFGMTTRWR